jgi:tetratricopeptide (TPR) repeat protein
LGLLPRHVEATPESSLGVHATTAAAVNALNPKLLRSRRVGEAIPNPEGATMMSFAARGMFLLLLVATALTQAAEVSGGMQSQGEPSDAEAFYARASERTIQGDYAGALRDLDEALRLRPDWVEAYVGRGNVRYIIGRGAGDIAELHRAIVDYSQALQIYPGSPLAYAGRAAARGTLEDWQGAVDDYTAALQLDPSLALAYFYRARYRTLVCDAPGAVADYEVAASAFQADEATYSQILAELAALREGPAPICAGR